LLELEKKYEKLHVVFFFFDLYANRLLNGKFPCLEAAWEVKFVDYDKNMIQY